MNRTSAVFTAALFAAAAGMAAGILLAPESGRKTRRKLLKKARKIGEELDDIAYTSREIIRDVQDSLDEIKENAEDAINKFLPKN